MSNLRGPARLRRRSTVLAAVAVPALILVGCGEKSEAPQAAQGVTAIGAFPVANTPTASPQTQISLRGAPAADLGTVTVSGSVTGAHPGRMKAHSDGKGASFVPDEPFSADGEKVTVATGLDIPGARDGDYSFTVVKRPASGLQSDPSKIDPKLLKALTGQTGKVVQGDATFKSRRDLRPPEVTIFKKATRTAPGSVFVAPKKVFGAKRPRVQSGPMIMDNAGRPIWFAPNDGGYVTDFRAQTYQGKPVLTWWQGRALLGTGEGTVQIVGEDYKLVKSVQGGNGYKLDFHEALLTPQNTLLGIVYNPISADLSSVGGAKRARAIDTVVQEIDVATGLVMFEWHSLSDIALNEGKGKVPQGSKALYDYVHGNSVAMTNDGNLLLSGRETWAAYKLNRQTGALISRIGGKKSDYKMLGTSRFAWQHDVLEQKDGTLTIFDNESAPKVRDETRGLALTVDEQAKTMKVKQEYLHSPKSLLAGTQGNTQVLANGNVFMGWGSQGYFSEYSADGKLLFDGRIARGQDSYRAYRAEWKGMPTDAPAVTTVGSSAYGSWNGATQVASWTVLTGDAKDELKAAGSAKRDGFETRITVRDPGRFVAMQAKGADGNVLGTSKVIAFKR